MALDSKNNIKSVFIVPVVTTAVTPGTTVTPGSLATKGTVVITNMSNQVLATTATGSAALFDPTFFDKIKIIKDRGADLPLQQVVLKKSEIVSATSLAGKPSTEQVTFIGSNGTTGSLATNVNSFYEIKLEHIPNSFAYGKRPANYKYGTYQSGLTAPSQADVANGLVASLVQNFRPNRNTDWRVFSEVTNSGGRTAATATAVVTLTFTKYSRFVKASAATASTNIVAGDYVAINAAVTTGVYKVTSKDGSGNLTLDIAYQGETTTIVAAAANIRIIAATANGANFGIKITGIKQKYDVNRWRQYDKVRFNTFINEAFISSTVTTTVTTTGAFDGIGVYEQVANDEYISWGDEGQIFVDQTPPQFREQDAAVGTLYSPAVIGWLDRLPSLIGAGENKGQAILYFIGASGSAAYTPTAGQAQIALINSFNVWSSVDLPTTFAF
jgi:hypothetical protein